MIDRSKYFTKINQTLFHGKMTPAQKQGMTSLLDEYDRRKLTDVRILAYIFATAYHETATTMQPIKEQGGTRYLTENYDISGKNPARAKSMGNTHVGDGVKYCGRGFVQLTWKVLYEKFGKELGIDLVNNPDLAMRDDVAAEICFTGLLDPKCSFTGVVLTKYITASKTDFIGARKTVNGTDEAAKIASYAALFHTALI